MITILSFKAVKGERNMYSEVSYDLATKEAIYLSYHLPIDEKIEKRIYKSIVGASCMYQADLKYAIENGYQVIINP